MGVLYGWLYFVGPKNFANTVLATIKLKTGKDFSDCAKNLEALVELSKTMDKTDMENMAKNIKLDW